jgi:hypothetical protein
VSDDSSGELVDQAFANMQQGGKRILGIKLFGGPVKMWGLPAEEIEVGKRIVVRHDARGQALNRPIVYELVMNPRLGVVGQHRGFATPDDLAE